MIRLGIVDCDTSHVVAFTQRLHHDDVGEDHWVDGAKVVAAVPLPSLVSPERVPRFVAQLRGYGIQILERPDAFLALHRRPLLRLYVAGVLWTDASEERSHANLRSALWRVRRKGLHLVETNGSSLSLVPSVEVDLDRTLTRCREALNRRIEGDAYISEDFAGDLLPDWYEDWVEAEREHVRQLRLHALEAVAEHHLGAGRFGHAVDAALFALQVDPLRESAHRLLIEIYIVEGNRGEALRQYRTFEDRLRAELGLEPSARLKDLVKELVSAA